MTATARAPWGAVLDELLADGDWHGRAELVDAITAAVPPGVAYRAGETARRYPKQWGTPAERKKGDHETAVAAGARRIANDVLRSRVRFGTVQRDGDRYRKAR